SWIACTEAHRRREFHFIGKEASTRWAGGPDPSMLTDAGALDPADETCREYEGIVDENYLDQIRKEAKQFSKKRLSCQSGVARSPIMNFKKGGTRSSRALCEADKGYSCPANQSMPLKWKSWQVQFNSH